MEILEISHVVIFDLNHVAILSILICDIYLIPAICQILILFSNDILTKFLFCRYIAFCCS